VGDVGERGRGFGLGVGMARKSLKDEVRGEEREILIKRKSKKRDKR